MRLEGKAVLITGAGSGIGRALALEAAGRGADLILAGRRETALRETAALLPGGARSVIAPGDVTAPETQAALVRAASEAFSRLDVLVNNAGTLSTGPLTAQDDGALAGMIRTNLFAPAVLTRDCLPLLRRSRGCVVNIGSMFGDIGYPLFSVYSATKFGLRGLSDALRRELAAEGVGVIHVAPRATHTESASAFAHLIEPFGMKMDRAERVARRTWNAVERGSRSVYPLGMELVFVLVQRLLPRVIDAGIGRQLSRVEDADLPRRLDSSPTD